MIAETIFDSIVVVFVWFYGLSDWRSVFASLGELTITPSGEVPDIEANADLILSLQYNLVEMPPRNRYSGLNC